MRLPIIPIIVAATLLMAAVYLFNASRSDRRILDVPRLSRIADIDGIESEVAIAPDGGRYAVVAGGDLWLLDVSAGSREQLTRTPELESFPAWSPDGKTITFTRGADTLAIGTETKAETVLRANATSLSWSPTSRTTYVRDRALWITNPGGVGEKQLVQAEPSEDITIRNPRFSPDSLQIAFIKTQLGLRGEVWIVDVLNGSARVVVGDRATENPLDAGWIIDSHHLVYLTNRAGSYSLWHIDFVESTNLPLTPPLITVPLSRIGIGVSNDRIAVPRHFLDSNIVLSDGTAVAAAADKIETEPAISPDGNLAAYTIVQENKSEIWTGDIDGKNATFRTLGREPRFGRNSYQIIYTHTDLNGNDDVWEIDIRNGSAERLTDADEIDVTPDRSPDGRTIAFASTRAGPLSIWSIPAAGGKRLKLNDGGVGPRYSPDGRSILFWNNHALWTMDAAGGNQKQVYGPVPDPTVAVWSSTGPAFFLDGLIRTASETLFQPMDHPIWPRFDVLSDGRLAVSSIDIRETGLWAVDLTYKP
jgi:Tol biopolymer transport system component